MKYTELKTENQKIKEMEKRIHDLRTSRRILMYLIERLEKEKTEIAKQNKKLQQNNSKYAKALLAKNKEIVHLRSHIQSDAK